MVTIKTDHFGTTRWYNDKNELHNENGPAIVYDNSIVWYNENGKYQMMYWYINGVEYTEEEFKQYKIKTFIDEK